MTAEIRMSRLFALVAAVAAAGLPALASAANVVVVNINAAGVGFNDPSAPNPAAGCNAGETLGQCRLRVFNQAAAQWGTLLQSNVTISINGQMTALTCSGTSAVLGSAGPTTAHSNFANAPRPNVAYVQALANSLAETDLSGSNDLNANFNQDIDNGTCLTGTAGWWYGTDPAVPVPNDRTPLLPVVFHEIGHGIGFTSLYSSTSGAPSTSDTPIWGFYLYDTETSKLWKDMTNGERVASAINDPDLVWTGPLTNAWSPVFLGPPAKAIINSPAGIAGVYDAQTGEFGPSVSSPTTGDVALVDDGVGTARDGCETPFANAAAVAGKIALIERGACNFTVKVKNAQLNGAIGALIFNNAATGLPPMGGADSTITISSLGVSQALGNSIIATLPTIVNATLGVDTSAALAGTQNGCIRMFAPNPVQSGSSVSHFHSDAFPNLLMEPSLNRSIFNKVDLTWALFRDIGWNLNPENVIFRDTFDNNPCAAVQP
jgi:hypothetical protein